MSNARYELRPATAADLEFAFQLKKANMRAYVERLRGWDDDAERAEMQKLLASGVYQIVLVGGQAAGILAVTRPPACLNLKPSSCCRSIKAAARERRSSLI